jgi:hypothetical protein
MLVAAAAVAQQSSRPPSAPIQDNSFLIEEAYNQEAGVVQHISTFQRLWVSRDWAYSFTQEWPVPGHDRHQLSYTAVVTDPGGFPGGAGLGDTYLNYRYQIAGNGDTRVAVAPRLSLLIPSGSARLGRGAGGGGVQCNLPVSIVLGKQFVTHINAGATLIPRARNSNGDRAFATSFNAGQSLVWLVRPRFNLLLETAWNRTELVTSPAHTASTDTVLLNPAIRWSHRLKNGLEIVPGIGVPVGIGPTAGERGLLLYLSFEHPMWGETKTK